MAQHLDIQELSIVVAVSNHNPMMLTVDFLKGSGIVPTDWELARPPVLSQGSAQVSFRNGINIVAQPGMITFSQAMTADAKLEQVMVAEVAQKYVKALPNLDYRAIGINPRRFVSFGDSPDAAHKYITERILAPGGWQQVGDAPMQAGINLVYSVNGVPLRLGINEARLQMPEQEAIPAVLFAGNFHHELAVENGADRLSALERQIENWRVDWDAYQDILNTKFLTQTEFESVFPIQNAS